MAKEIQDTHCQISNLQQMTQKTGLFGFFLQIFFRIQWAFYRRWRYLVRALSGKHIETFSSNISRVKLLSGDYVRVKTKEEIISTLNLWNELKGCAFMDEMEAYCGTTQKVLKCVERFVSEQDYRIRRSKGILLLDGVMCQGTKIFGRCDRACFFFWREEWLEKIEPKL